LKRSLLFLLLAFLLTLSAVWAQQGYMEVTAPERTGVLLALAPPVLQGGTAQTELAREMDEVLRFDLGLAGNFSILPSESAGGRGGLRLGEFDLGPWRSLGTELLVKSGYQLNGDNLTVEFRLLDIPRERELLAKRYTGKKREIRRICHLFADEVLAAVTGTRGPFTGKVAYVSTVNGNKELYLMDYDGHGVQRLTRNGSINLNPDFSPSGRELIYTSYRGGNPDLYRREIFSGAEAKVSGRTGLNAMAAYAPDGSRIALTLSKDGNSEIYLIGKDGSLGSRLTNNPAIEISPAWSPDGRQIAFVSDRLGNPQVFIMNADGSEVRRLTTSGSYNVSPRWSPKGDRIVYCRREGGGFQIYSIASSGSGDQQLTTKGSNEHPRWSPDGRFIVYSSKQGGREGIYVMRSDGTGQTKVSRGSASDNHPVWSVNW
jgi:TolB protein